MRDKENRLKYKSLEEQAEWARREGLLEFDNAPGGYPAECELHVKRAQLYLTLSISLELSRLNNVLEGWDREGLPIHSLVLPIDFVGEQVKEIKDEIKRGIVTRGNRP